MKGRTLIDFFAIALLLALTACGGGGDTANGASDTSDETDLKVSALYPASGARWNDYVKNDGTTRYTASDTACAGTETGSYSACLHGGEMRVVDVPGESDCAGLSASDALDAFDWVCDDSAPHVRLISRGLKEGKHLSDLVDFATGEWKPNAPKVAKNGVVLDTTPESIWWDNPVAVHNQGGVLDGVGTIYLVTANPDVSHAIATDKVALVVQPGVTLTATGNGNSLVSVTSRKFTWVEGRFDATNYTYGIRWTGVVFSVARRVHVANATSYGVRLDGGSNNNRLSDLRATGSGSAGVLLEDSSFNIVSRMNGDGIRLNSSGGNILDRVNAASRISAGINLGFGSHNNVLHSITATGNGPTAAAGIRVIDSNSNIVFAMTLANNDNRGLRLLEADSNTFSGLAAVNSNFVDTSVTNSSSNTFAGIAVDGNFSSSYGVRLTGSSNNQFTGRLKIGSDYFKSCDVTGGTDPGLTDTTCANNGRSDASLTTDISVASSFAGKLFTDDPLNESDISGSASFDTISDWTTFDNAPYRAWGRDGDAFPSRTNVGRCVSGETCRIWDWSLANGDTGDDGNPVLQNVLALPTGNDTLTHTWGAADATACAGIAGAVWDSSTGVCATTFLRHAVEIIDDDVGNNNVLCESDERCLYTPNIGSYQGHGRLIPAGSFVDGTLVGITLFRHEVNGF